MGAAALKNPAICQRDLWECWFGGPNDGSRKKLSAGALKLPPGRRSRPASSTGVNPAGKFRKHRWEKANVIFLTSVVWGLEPQKSCRNAKTTEVKKISAGRASKTDEGDDFSPGLARSGSAARRRDSIFEFAAGEFFDHYGGRVQPEDSSTCVQYWHPKSAGGATRSRTQFGQSPRTQSAARGNPRTTIGEV